MKTIGIFAILLLCVSCGLDYLVDVEELGAEQGGNNIEIFAIGGITSQYAYQKITLVKPQPISSGQRDDIPIREAKVYVVSGIDTIFYDDIQRTHYNTSQKAKAEPNREYTMYIEYKGKTYIAKDKAPPIESIGFGEAPVPQYYRFIDKWYFLVIRNHYFGYQKPFYWRWISLAHTDFDNYLRAPYSISTYIHQGFLPQGIYGMNVENDDVNGNFGTSVNDSVLAVKYSMSQDQYNYRRATYIEVSWDDNEFRGIPANLPTNFSKGAAGFFYVMDHKTLKCTVKDILDFHGTEYPEEDPGGE